MPALPLSNVSYASETNILYIDDITGISFGRIVASAVSWSWGCVSSYGTNINALYECSANMEIGKGTNSTGVSSMQETVYFNGAYCKVKANAALTVGEEEESWSRKGAYWRLSGTQDTIYNFCDGGAINIYGSILETAFKVRQRFDTGSVKILNSTLSCSNDQGNDLDNRFEFRATLTSCILKNVYSCNANIGFFLELTPDAVEDCWAHDSPIAVLSNDPTVVMSGISITDCATHMYVSSGDTLTFKNPRRVPTQSEVTVASGGQYGLVTYTWNVHVADKDGTDLSGVSVVLTGAHNSGTSRLFDDETDSNGDIAEQTVNYKKWIGTSETEYDWVPYTLTLSKDGYETLTLEGISIDEVANGGDGFWGHFELQPKIKLNVDCSNPMAQLTEQYLLEV